MRVEASAPSNIAWIKYMGKEPGTGNLPANPSLSYSLDNLRSFVVLEPAVEDAWAPLEGFPAISLSDEGRKRFLNHFARLKTQWGIQGHFRVLSANNFPSDCGLASSASSFAALTLAAYAVAQKQNPKLELAREEISKISRTGSGSSCRSLFSPWAQWDGEGARALDFKLRLEHAVIIVDAGKKAVSSTEAHRRVNASLLWPGRAERARARLTDLKDAIEANDWRRMYEVCWEEFWDMHALFETSRPPFGFMTEGTLAVLNHVRGLWQKRGDGPVVTMDAGANVHLFLRENQIHEAETWIAGHKSMRSWA